jgi:hypothetical protein
MNSVQEDIDLMEEFDKLTGLTELQKTAIKKRLYSLLAEFRRRCYFYAVLFYSLRITITAGSLAVPALISIQNCPDENLGLFWFTWTLSLAVTMANGLSTLFRIDRRYFQLHATNAKLRTETWQYLELSGRYSGHRGGPPTHTNQYVFYCSQLEKVRMKQVEEEFIKNADMDSQKPPLATQFINGRRAYMESIMVPSPAEQIHAIQTPPTPQIRTDALGKTSYTIGETYNNDSIIHIEQGKEKKEDEEAEEK